VAEGGPAAGLRRTPLFALHESLGARIVPFAGYAMPLQYPTGIIREHLHTRARAGLFDVSHMGQIRVTGRGAAAGLESLMPIDVIALPGGRQRYGFLTDSSGGVLDDLMLANAGDSWRLVVNAACKAQDVAHLRDRLPGACTVDLLDDRALLALQGPAAADVMERLAPGASAMTFMDAAAMPVAGVAAFVSRSGYTGEDGFELSVAARHAEALARTLLNEPDVSPAGLGARDSLRLEAGLCLYGQDLDATTSPVEAGLSWAVSPARRTGGARAGGFPGADVILEQLASGTTRRRVGLLPQSRIPVRAGGELLDARGVRVGVVTSGGFGPTLGAPVAMGYVDAEHAASGTELGALVRGQRIAIRVSKLPAVPHAYHRSR
jgi:aminomethyltransferase